MIKFGMMSTTEVRHSYSLNHLINVFPPVRKYFFFWDSLTKNHIFLYPTINAIGLPLETFLELIFFWYSKNKDNASFSGLKGIILRGGFFSSQKLWWFGELCGKSHHTHFMCCLIPQLISLAMEPKWFLAWQCFL